jgi:hypothetical protein
MFRPSREPQNGFVALMSVLIVTTVAVVIGTVLTLRTITHGENSFAEVQSVKSWSMINACAETALGLISYGGTTTWAEILDDDFSLTIDDNSCDLWFASVNSDYRRLRASSTVDGYIRRLEIVVSTNTPVVLISSWGEVGEFQ